MQLQEILSFTHLTVQKASLYVAFFFFDAGSPSDEKFKIEEFFSFVHRSYNKQTTLVQNKQARCLRISKVE